MTTFVFAPPTDEQLASWDDPAVWQGGVVPSGPDADVLLPETGAGTNPADIHTVAIAAGQSYEVASLTADAQDVVLAGTLTVDGSLALQDGADLVLTGGSLAARGGTTLDSQSEILGNGTLAGPVVDDGSIVVLPTATGTAPLTVTGAVSGSGTLAIGTTGSPLDSSASLELAGPDSAGVVFGALGGVLVLDDATQFGGTITPGVPQQAGTGSQFPADQVVLAGFSLADVTAATYAENPTGGTVTIVAAGTTLTLPIAGNFNASNFSLAAGPTAADGASSILLQIAPGFAKPTLGLLLPNGADAGLAIVNTGTPTVTGTIPQGTGVQLVADGSVSEGAAPAAGGGGTGSSGTYSTTLPASLAPGAHEIVAHASTATASLRSDPLDLYVLPNPVDGITTAGLSSYQFAFLLGEGAATQYVAGTEAIVLTDGTLSVGPDTGSALVQRLYEGLLDRAGDPPGLAGLTATLNADGPAAVATAMLDSSEFAALHGAPAAMDDTGFVTMLFAGLLGRSPDPAGLAANLQTLARGASRASLAADIANSPEAKQHLAADTTNVWVPNPDGALVTQLFETGLGRAPDAGGLATFTAALQNGATAQQVAALVAGSPEFLADHAGQSATALVTSLYEHGLGRTPDPAGLQLWAGALQSGASTPAGVLLGIAASPEAYAHLIRAV